MLDMMRDDKSRYEQLRCQMPDEEAVTHQIGSVYIDTWMPPDGMGESIATSKVGEEYICKSIEERSNRNRFDFFVLLERFKGNLRKISIFPVYGVNGGVHVMLLEIFYIILYVIYNGKNFSFQYFILYII